MQKLNIKTEEGEITLDLSRGNFSLALTNDAANDVPAATSKPKLEFRHVETNGSVNYEAAEKAIAALGNGWRMPEVDEVLPIIDRTRHNPAVDPEKFPGIKSAYYWTNTPCAWNTSAVWVVVFSGGLVGYNHRSGKACVLAVRSGQ